MTTFKVLLEYDGSLVIADGGRAGLPLDFVIGRFASLYAGRKIPLESYAGPLFGWSFCLQPFYFRKIDGEKSHSRGFL